MSAPKKILNPVIPTGQTFKVIGLGGVGGIVARYLSVFLAQTTARLLLIDGDNFEPKNASRMLFKKYGNKAEVTCDELRDCLGEVHLLLDFITEYVNEGNIANLIHEDNIIILAVDNHATRKLVNQHCATLKNVVLISGGNDGIEEAKDGGRVHRGTYGNVQVYIRKDGKDITHPLTTYHPEIAHPGDKHPEELSCAELVMSTPQILFTNMQVATCMLSTLWLHLSEGALHYSEIAFDVADGVMNPIPLPEIAETDYDPHHNNSGGNTGGNEQRSSG